MRILHTGDWHVGKQLRGRSRFEEHRAVLAELAAVADQRDVDVAVVAGDLFDTASPAPEAERLVYQALLDLARDDRHVVVVAGNHDSPRRLQAVAPLAGLARIHVQPFVAAPGAGGVLRLTDRRGERAVVALLPWLSQRYVVSADALFDRDADQHQLAYQDRVRAVVGALCQPFEPGTVNLVVGHLHALGGVAGGGERAVHTVLDYAVPATVFPATASYVALGHLHRTQQVDGPAPAWYPGSPLQLDFGEAPHDRAVLVVEARPGVPAVVDAVPLSSGRRLRTLEGTLADLERQRGGVGDDWLRIVVNERGRAGLADEVRDLFPDVVDVRLAPLDDGAGEGGPRPTARLGRSPAELFAEYLADRRINDPRLRQLFDELYEAAAAEERHDAS